MHIEDPTVIKAVITLLQESGPSKLEAEMIIDVAEQYDRLPESDRQTPGGLTASEDHVREQLRREVICRAVSRVERLANLALSRLGDSQRPVPEDRLIGAQFEVNRIYFHLDELLTTIYAEAGDPLMQVFLTPPR